MADKVRQALRPRHRDYAAGFVLITAASVVLALHITLLSARLEITIPQYVVAAGGYFTVLLGTWLMRLKTSDLPFPLYLLVYGLTSVALALFFVFLLFFLVMGPNL